jgi:hypothetical protein
VLFVVAACSSFAGFACRTFDSPLLLSIACCELLRLVVLPLMQSMSVFAFSRFAQYKQARDLFTKVFNDVDRRSPHSLLLSFLAYAVTSWSRAACLLC